MTGGNAAGAGERAIEIGGFPGMAANPIVDQRVAGARIEGEDFVLTAASPWPDPGDIADPAEIEDGERLRQIGGERGMVEGRQRSPLPARGGRSPCCRRLEPFELVA